MGLTYGYEKLWKACDYAVGSSDTPQKKLEMIMVSDFLGRLDRREHLPSDESWQKVQEIFTAMTCKAAKRGEGSVAATTSQMSTEEARKWLREIFVLFCVVADGCGRQFEIDDTLRRLERE